MSSKKTVKKPVKKTVMKKENKTEEQAEKGKVIPINEEAVQNAEREQAAQVEQAAQNASVNAINSYVALLNIMLEGDDRLKGLYAQFIKTMEITKPELFPSKEGK